MPERGAWRTLGSVKIESPRLAVSAPPRPTQSSEPAVAAATDRVVLGGAVSAAPTEADRALARVLQQASEQGVSFIEQSSLSSVEVPASRAYAVLSGAEASRGGIVWTDGRRSQPLSSEQDALAYAFFTGVGSLDGVERPELAKAVKAVETDGVRFYAMQERSVELSLFAAWSALAHPVSQAALVGLGVGGVRLAPCHGGDLGLARQAVAPWLSAWNEVLVPSGRPDRELRAVMSRLSTVPPERVAETARLFLGVYEAVERCGHISPYQVRDEIDKMNRWVDERKAKLDAPTVQLPRLISWIGACGPQGAREAADVAFDRLRREHPDEAGYARAVALFDTLVRALGDAGAADEAIGVVSAPIGSASEAERLAAFERLAAQHPAKEGAPSSRGQAARRRAAEAAADYAAVRASAPADGKALSERVDQFALLADALSKVHQGEETRATFVFIENGLREGAFGDADRQAVTLRFLEALVKTGDAAAARDQSLRAASGEAGAGGVTREGDTVVIGGVRVPVRPSA